MVDSKRVLVSFILNNGCLLVSPYLLMREGTCVCPCLALIQ